jgi:hypothetical protein
MRIVLTVIGCIVVAYAAFVMLVLIDFPTAVVCERGRTYVEATPHRVNKGFEEYRVGPCTFFNPEGRGGVD